MNSREQAECEHLRSLSSEAAAAWLMSTYPIDSPSWGHVIKVLPHRSWQKKEQITLARYYLQGIPYASERIYEAFSSFMAVPVLVSIIKERLPLSLSDSNLLHYHLAPVLRSKAQRPEDVTLVNHFLAELSHGAQPALQADAAAQRGLS